MGGSGWERSCENKQKKKVGVGRCRVFWRRTENPPPPQSPDSFQAFIDAAPETLSLFRPFVCALPCSGSLGFVLFFHVAVAPSLRHSQSIGASQTGRQTQRAPGGTA